MFWFGYDEGGGGVIVSFDLATEEFTLIPFPPLEYWDNERLIVYDNKLAIVSAIFGEDASYSIHLWVMEEVMSAVGRSWN